MLPQSPTQTTDGVEYNIGRLIADYIYRSNTDGPQNIFGLGQEIHAAMEPLRKMELEIAPLRELVGVDSRAASSVDDIKHWTKLMDAYDEAAKLKQRVAQLEEDARHILT